VTAIRSADPQAKVGGPALANPESPILPALLAACQSQNIPLDFISWHIYNSDPLAIRATIDRKKELLENFPRLHPETILDEWNMSLSHPVTDPRFQPAFVTETAWQMKDGGLDYSCYYHIRDYHVDPGVFAKIMSPGGNAGMTAWWNRKAQYDGLFDFQNHIRPAYFAFRLLSRMTGERVPLTSSDQHLHGFATFDPFFGSWNILLWNFSEQPRHVNLLLDGITTTLHGDELELDALAPSDDENIRLRPLPSPDLSPSSTQISTELKPWDILYWSLKKQ
jgi:xylan 1,4-beta-xylosidase